MKFKFNQTAFLGSLLFTLSCSQSHAISITDVQFGGANADAAVLNNGNDNVNGINSLGGAFGDGNTSTMHDNWTLLDKTDESSANYYGLTFEITTQDSGNDGSFVLSWGQNSNYNSALMLDLVFVTKAAQSYGAYLFNQQLLNPIPVSENGSFYISWTNGGGKSPDISHISVYGRPAYPTPPHVSVSEPASIALLSLGLVGIGALRRKAVKH